MSNDSWKRYGGVSKTDKFKNLTIGTIVADQVLLRQKVSTITSFNTSINVAGGLSVTQDVSGQNINASNRLTAKDATILNLLTLGNGITNYLFSNDTGIGINNGEPSATLDICGNLIVRSPYLNTRNIIAQNKNIKGIVVSVDANDYSYIDFFNTNNTNNTNAGASDAKLTVYRNTFQVDATNIKINSGLAFDISSNITGNIRTGTAMKLSSNASIDLSANKLLNLISPDTTIYSRLHITNRDVSSNLLNETMVVYDISAGRYLYDIYNNNTYNKGNALTLVSNNNASNTFMNMITPSKLGLGIGGGSYINDTTRSFGTIGVFDADKQYIPAQNIVSGNSKAKYYSTVGVNKHSPKTENYVMDINGATRITNGEINKVQDVSFQILNVAFSKIEPSFGIAVGTPSSPVSPYKQSIYYTNDGGLKWIETVVDNTTAGIAGSSKNFCIYVYNRSYAVIGTILGNLLFTTDGGASWTKYNVPGYNFNNIFILKTSATNYRVFTTYDNSYGYFNTTNTSFNEFTRPSNTITNFVDGNSKYIYYVGTGIQRYVVSNNNLDSSVLTTNTYNHIAVFEDNYAIAVGNNIISYTNDGGKNWNNITLTNTILNMCYIYDSQRAVAVGERGNLLYTIDGYKTWNIIPNELLNSGGNSKILNGSTSSLKTVYMPNINSFVISKIIQTYIDDTQFGLSNIYYCYLPNLFNRSQNSVLDVSGSSLIAGDLTVTEGGKLIAHYDSSFNGNLVVNYDTSLKSRLYVDSDTTINKRLFTIGDVSFSGNLFVSYDTSLNSRLYVTSDAKINKRLFVLGDVSFTSNLYVNYDTRTNGNLFVSYDTSLNSRLYVASDTTINKRLFTMDDVRFSGSLYVAKDATIIGNLNVTNKIVNNSDVTMKSNLFVDYDASINGSVYVGNDIVINGNLRIKQGENKYIINTKINNYELIISEDLSLNGTLVASGDVSLNSNLYVSKNMWVNTDNNIENALVNINGNMITNYIGINTTTVNTNRALDINGNVVQSNGCIFQF